ncbi:MAG: polyprenyl synthetase family protein [Promethearchaeota archaeon]
MEAYLDNEFERDLNLKAINQYEQAFLNIINGVLIETDMVNQKTLSIDDYIEMVSLKTGALIEKSILIGANYSKADSKSCELLSVYGINLGIIFQIIDDILGTFGDEKLTGKPTDGDIREGKHTLLIEALNESSDLDKKRIIKLIEKPEMSEAEVQEVRDLFQKADVINSCKDLAKKYYEEAQNALDKLRPKINNSEMEFFEDLLQFVYNRSF